MWLGYMCLYIYIYIYINIYIEICVRFCDMGIGNEHKIWVGIRSGCGCLHNAHHERCRPAGQPFVYNAHSHQSWALSVFFNFFNNKK